MARAIYAGTLMWFLVELCRGGIPWTPAFLASAAAAWVYRRRPAALVFFASAALYLSTFHWRGGDDIPTSLVPLALLRHGSLALDRVLDPWLSGKAENFILPVRGHVLSVFPITASVLAAPLYVLPVLLGAPIFELFLHNLAKLAGSLLTAGSACALFLALRRLSSERWALGLAGLYALGTHAWSVSSQGLWEHGPTSLGLALGLWGLAGDETRDDLLAGFGMGLAVASRPDSALVAVPCGLYLLSRSPASFARYLAGAALPMALPIGYWLAYTGRPLPPELGHHAKLFERFHPDGLAAVLASPTRGLFLFSPFLAFGLWGGLRREEPLGRWLLAGFAGSVALVSFYGAWGGGMSFGSRYFAGISVVLAFLCARLESPISSRPALRTLWPAAGALAVATHACGAYFRWPGSFAFEAQNAEAWRLRLNPLLHLFTRSGGLDRLPIPARAAVALLFIAAAGGAGWALGRYALGEDPARS